MGHPPKAHAYIYINDICNQKCLFCSRPPGGVPVSSRYIFGKIDGYAADSNVGRVIFTGGEPTLHPELERYISYASSKGLIVDIQTNGSVLREADYKRLRDAGLRSVNFAYTSHIKGISDVLRGVVGGFSEIENGLAGAIASGLDISLVIVMNNLNIGNLSDMVRHAASLGASKDKLRLNLMMVCPNGAAWENKEIIIPDQMKMRTSLIDACRTSSDLGIPFDISEVVPLCLVNGYEDAVSSTAFRVRDIRIIDDNYNNEGSALDFNNDDQAISMKAPRCADCSLNSLCVGFYPRIAEFCGTEVFIPRNDELEVIMKKIVFGEGDSK